MRFKVALSFPGEKREFIEKVAHHLAETLGQPQILYDRFHEEEFARPNLAISLPHSYRNESELIVLFLCSEYPRKEWCGLELRAAIDLVKSGQNHKVMILRFDNEPVDGILSIDGFIDISERSPEAVSQLILNRLRINQQQNGSIPPNEGEHTGSATKDIDLASFFSFPFYAQTYTASPDTDERWIKLLWGTIDKSQNIPNTADDLVELILSENENVPIQLKGPPGVGKSALLSALFNKCKLASPPQIHCLYLNLHAIDNLVPSPESDFAAYATGVLERLANWLRVDCTYRMENGIKTILFLDGVDEHCRGKFDYAFQFCNNISPLACNLRMVSIGLPDNLGNYRTPAREIHPTLQSRDSITLQLERLKREQASERFIGESLQLMGFSSLSATKVLLDLDLHGIDEIDLLTIKLFAMCRLKSGTNMNGFGMAKICEFSCRQALENQFSQSVESGQQLKAIINDRLDKLSRIAFEINVLKRRPEVLDAPDLIETPLWELATGHRLFVSFLIARHLFKTIGSLGDEDGEDINSPINRVYSSDVMKVCKELINQQADPSTLFSSLESYVNLCEKSAPTDNSRSIRFSYGLIMATYLLGRFEQRLYKIKGAVILRRLKQRLIEREKEDPTTISTYSPEDMLYKRTIYISLICLEDLEASGEYIRSLLGDTRANDFNNGFHLEYYGDALAGNLSGQLLQADDDGHADFANTFRKLEARVRLSLERRKLHPLFEVELFTICSLAQKRHFLGTLSDSRRSDIIKIIADVLKESVVKEDLRSYLFTLKHYLEHYRRSSKLHLVVELLQLKVQMRQGWMDHGVQKPESIAAHVYGAYLIGYFLLPDHYIDDVVERSVKKSDYSKHRILQMILIHDLAEAFIGDIPTDKKTQKHREDESLYLSLIGRMGVASNPGSLMDITELYAEFESCTTLNARIARDIDKLDMVIQAQIYKLGFLLSDNSAKVFTETIMRSEFGRRIQSEIQHFFQDVENNQKLFDRYRMQLSAPSPSKKPSKR